MKRTGYIIAAVLLIALALTVVFVRHGSTGDGLTSALTPGGGEYYTCPMHPSVIAYKPGACPVCGMALVKKTGSGHAGPAEAPDSGDVLVTREQRVQANITTAAVRRISFSAPVVASGVVAFAEPGQSIVAARGRGRIEHLFVSRTGAVVRKGEPLVALYSPDIVSAQEEYRIALALPADTTRDQLVAASGNRLRERFGFTESQVSALARAQTVQSPAVYTSPVSGTVIRKGVVEGQYVEEGATLFELADLSRVWVVASVPEQAAQSVAQGESADVTLDAYPGVTFRGRVVFVEPVLDADSRTLRVRTELANPGGKLKPNMYAKVMLHSASREVLVVPASAVLFTGRRPLVWVESAPGRFSPHAVRVGETSGGFIEILSGVEEGDMVAETGGFLIDSESQLANPARTEHFGHHM
jgi:Cu(I)/Ag(I) efflux system membrane fusion protein